MRRETLSQNRQNVGSDLPEASGKPTPFPILRFSLTAALSIWAVLTLLRIEYWNMQAEFKLPRHDPEFTSPTSNPKWRIATREAAHSMFMKDIRIQRFRKTGNRAYVDDQKMAVQLSAAEEVELKCALDLNEKEIRLRRLVSTVGVLQYPVILVLGVLSCLIPRRKERYYVTSVWASRACTALCVVMMIYRGYWSSLGLL